jgi:uncharacterized membrane protein
MLYGRFHGNRASFMAKGKRRALYDKQLEHDIVIHETVEFVVIVALVALLLGFIAMVGIHLQAGHVPFGPMVYLMSSFTLLHCVYLTGWRRALCFFALTVVLSFAFEYAGVHTGAVFGSYRYTTDLGVEILGTVPVVILPAYFLVVYPGYLMGNLLTRGKPLGHHARLPAILWASLLTAAIATAWDLTLEPEMVHDAKAWIWEEGGPYFGIPFHNFIGWLVTTFTISLVYRLVEKRVPLHPLGRGRKRVVLLPLLGYAGLCVGDILMADPVGIRVIAPFAMGVPVVAAAMRLFEPE